ncbi:MAG: hypothetical protein ABI254_14225 [Chthoniobacterales bacterium]
MRKGQMLQIVNNMRQIQQITASAALDRGVTGDTNIIGWPGTNIGFSVWVRSLTNASISEKVIEKLFSGPGVKVDGFPEYAQGKTAYRVYQVSEDSATNTVFLSTYSWNAEAPNTDGKGFVIMHKDGRGVSYSAKQATNTNGE